MNSPVLGGAAELVYTAAFSIVSKDYMFAGTPKSLLPVGNELLISFPLKSLEDAGIKEVFVVNSHLVKIPGLNSWSLPEPILILPATEDLT